MKKVKTKAENIGKGKVTPIQVAFIVDRYLSDNDFSETRSTFCSEASHILSNLPVKEVINSRTYIWIHFRISNVLMYYLNKLFCDRRRGVY